jgi:hypothetical protein
MCLLLGISLKTIIIKLIGLVLGKLLKAGLPDKAT